MARYFDDKRKGSTKVRDARVHELLAELKGEYGDIFVLLPKSYIYDRLSKSTGLCTKTVAYIINHTNP